MFSKLPFTYNKKLGELRRLSRSSPKFILPRLGLGSLGAQGILRGLRDLRDAVETLPLTEHAQVEPLPTPVVVDDPRLKERARRHDGQRLIQCQPVDVANAPIVGNITRALSHSVLNESLITIPPHTLDE
jgi:hypothetical protein